MTLNVEVNFFNVRINIIVFIYEVIYNCSFGLVTRQNKQCEVSVFFFFSESIQIKKVIISSSDCNKFNPESFQ